jgi:CrcB protein
MTEARTDLRTVALVGIGGAAGTLTRYGLDRLTPVAAGTFPTTTFTINVSGAFVLGLLLGVLARSRPSDRVWRPLLGVGFLGGYTTFSTFALETTQLLRAHDGAIAVAYVVASVGVGLLAARLGELATGVAPTLIDEAEM